VRLGARPTRGERRLGSASGRATVDPAELERLRVVNRSGLERPTKGVPVFAKSLGVLVQPGHVAPPAQKGEVPIELPLGVDARAI
jgi:hypothetical protein